MTADDISDNQAAAADLLFGEVVLEGRIRTEMAQQFRRRTMRAAKALLTQSQPAVLRIVINSRGGGFTAGNYIISQIRRLQASGLKVEAFIAGDCESMAAMIAATCDRTVISRTGRLMWHGLSLTQFAGDENTMTARLQELQRQNQMMLEVLLARARRTANCRHPVFADRDKLADLLRKNSPNWLSAKEALEAGLADEIGEPAFSLLLEKDTKP